MRTSLKVPSSKGVSAGSGETLGRLGRDRGEGDLPGPNITAFHTIMLSGHGLPETPLGGSLDSRLKSRISRRLQFVD